MLRAVFTGFFPFIGPAVLSLLLSQPSWALQVANPSAPCESPLIKTSVWQQVVSQNPHLVADEAAKIQIKTDLIAQASAEDAVWLVNRLEQQTEPQPYYIHLLFEVSARLWLTNTQIDSYLTRMSPLPIFLKPSEERNKAVTALLNDADSRRMLASYCFERMRDYPGTLGRRAIAILAGEPFRFLTGPEGAQLKAKWFESLAEILRLRTERKFHATPFQGLNGDQLFLGHEKEWLVISADGRILRGEKQSGDYRRDATQEIPPLSLDKMFATHPDPEIRMYHTLDRVLYSNVRRVP